LVLPVALFGGGGLLFRLTCIVTLLWFLGGVHLFLDTWGEGLSNRVCFGHQIACRHAGKSDGAASFAQKFPHVGRAFFAQDLWGGPYFCGWLRWAWVWWCPGVRNGWGWWLGVWCCTAGSKGIAFSGGVPSTWPCSGASPVLDWGLSPFPILPDCFQCFGVGALLVGGWGWFFGSGVEIP
jgi:hypothetical protein